MKKEVRTICYDHELKMEAYRLEGIVQPFPNHFHEYYVLGYMVAGRRYLSCKNKNYELQAGDFILFHPEDNHACASMDSEPLHYLAVNITKQVMQKAVLDITGKEGLPQFRHTVINDKDVSSCFMELHQCMMDGTADFEKEELFIVMLTRLLKKYCTGEECREAKLFDDKQKEVEAVCRQIEQEYASAISLDQLCECAGCSKSTLLRTFTKYRGMTPYRYLQAVRIGAARKMLEEGVPLVEVAMKTGFSDQSHFTRFFMMFIGLAPGAYRDIFKAD